MQSNYFPQNQSSMGPTGSGPLCILPVSSVPMLIRVAVRFICSSTRYIPPDMDTHEGVCQPTLELGRQDLISGSHTAGQDCTGKPSVEVTTKISNSVTDAHRLPQVNIIKPSSDVRSRCSHN